MRRVSVALGERSYDILISSGLLDRLGQAFEGYPLGKRIFLVTNSTVDRLFGEKTVRSLAARGLPVSKFLIPDGEQHKSLATVEEIYAWLIGERADRSATLVALGGGVAGDVVGFAAATFLRGVPYVQIPTTLLAQVDSSVGGKTGVNLPAGKNLVGAFYQPRLVCVDTDTLATLPDREYRSGCYEVIKYGLIRDREFFHWLQDRLDRILAREKDVLEALIARCCEIKAEVTAKDERESGLRRILNFGHTLGHALEAVTEYRALKHGEAVAYGMIFALRLSRRLGLLEEAAGLEAEGCIRKVGPLPSVPDRSPAALSRAMSRDKKRVDDRTVFVLLEEIGTACFRSDLDELLLMDVWEGIRRGD